MVKKIAETIAKNIKKTRKEKGFTLKDLSTGSKVSISMISKIENSQTLPSIATYIKIASALGVSFSQLISDDSTEVDISIVKSTERPIITKGPYIASPLAYKKGKKKWNLSYFTTQKERNFLNIVMKMKK